MKPIFSEPCNLCGSMGVCQECADELNLELEAEQKINVASGEDVCLSLNEDGGYCYKDLQKVRDLSPLRCNQTGSSAWDTIRTLKPILGNPN